MNGGEKTILEVVANDVKWIREGVVELRKDFKCQIATCNERMNKQDKKINDNMKKIYWILGILAAAGITTGTVIGVT